jgi:hypothetical protein
MPKNREPQIENPACSIEIHLSEIPTIRPLITDGPAENLVSL